jgi:hypothetical protein
LTFVLLLLSSDRVFASLTKEDRVTDDKRSKVWGEPVSKEEVLRELGHPSAWEPNSRQVEFRNRLKRGQADLDIGGIRGYGRMKGYLRCLEETLIRPLGVGTGLVSEEEDGKILEAIVASVAAEIAKYQARLAELERSPEAVAAHVAEMRSWLAFVEKLVPMDPDLEDLDELKEMARESNADREREIASLKADIAKYESLHATLIASG